MSQSPHSRARRAQAIPGSERLVGSSARIPPRTPAPVETGFDVGAPPEAGLVSDARTLVLGYLNAVATRLRQCGIPVREVRAYTRRPAPLAGLLLLDPPEVVRRRWTPARLHWEQNSGWRATLLPTEPGAQDEGGHAVSRYLTHQLVPTPGEVAHFVAALCADESTIWASATFQPPQPIDRRCLLLRLSRYALPRSR